ncbi:MAG: tetratricopeptide repeat protein [Ferruginibacter sp.]|nr:tetratricopeptide repeat protein [Ferruginibacter sp.]
MADTKETTTTVIGPENNEALVKARSFWDKYSKPIIYAGSAVILVIAGWLGYQNFIKIPKEKEANAQIFPAEAIFDKMATTEFNKDSVNIALNGGSVEGRKVTGLLKLISKYDGTPAANRAKYMVGASYLQLKEFDKAIKYLKDFDGNGAGQVESAAYLMLGHAYSEQKKTEDALSYYKKAADVNARDESLSPNALLIAASYANEIGKSKDAIELYRKLKDKYPTSASVTNGEVDKQLAKLGEMNNQ